MERLTKYGNTSHENGVCCTHFNSKECKEVSGNCAYDCKWEEEAWSKLAAYEDAEEQGLLLRLPCKVGDTIYKIPSKVNHDLNIVNKHPENNKVYEQPVYSIQMWSNNSYILNTCNGLDCVRSDSFKETWFLTKAEAEKALAEMGRRYAERWC